MVIYELSLKIYLKRDESVAECGAWNLHKPTLHCFVLSEQIYTNRSSLLGPNWGLKQTGTI